MKITLTLTDKRTVPNRNYRESATEDYDRVSISEMSGSEQVIAGALRAIADSIDPKPARSWANEATLNYGGAS